VLARRSDDRELLAVPIEGVDVYVTSGMSTEDARRGGNHAPQLGAYSAQGSPAERSRPRSISAGYTVAAGRRVTLVGRTQTRGSDQCWRCDRATDVADVAFIGAAIAIGALVGAIVYRCGVPITLSTAGGALFSGLFFGCCARCSRHSDGFHRPPCGS